MAYDEELGREEQHGDQEIAPEESVCLDSLEAQCHQCVEPRE
jgi:hypothetical protein